MKKILLGSFALIGLAAIIFIWGGQNTQKDQDLAELLQKETSPEKGGVLMAQSIASVVEIEKRSNLGRIYFGLKPDLAENSKENEAFDILGSPLEGISNPEHVYSKLHELMDLMPVAQRPMDRAVVLARMADLSIKYPDQLPKIKKQILDEISSFVPEIQSNSTQSKPELAPVSYPVLAHAILLEVAGNPNESLDATIDIMKQLKDPALRTTIASTLLRKYPDLTPGFKLLLEKQSIELPPWADFLYSQPSQAPSSPASQASPVENQSNPTEPVNTNPAEQMNSNPAEPMNSNPAEPMNTNPGEQGDSNSAQMDNRE
ncbi:MAG: hypothetical protein ABIQ95_01130 [Bdellovibrionia bacterium]